MKANIKMFADDAKMSGPVNCAADQEILQEDLKRLQSWTDDWLLRFNTAKCKVLHLGYHNKNLDYHMSEGEVTRTLETTKCEKDLGVYVDPSLKFTQHCQKAAGKANRLVGLIRRSFSYLDGPMMVKLFKALVRPHLENANVVWSPQLKKDSALLESVQRRASHKAHTRTETS